MNDDQSHATGLSARDVHREQVWAALLRAMDALLDESLNHIEDDLRRAQRNDDDEWTDRLLGRQRLLKELRRVVTSSPP